jgi:iron complex outermembrane receptor protein
MQYRSSKGSPKAGRQSRLFLLAITPVAIVIFAGRATAAGSDGDAATAPKSTDALAEIVVTAQKRNETVQTTPISITALSAGQIEAQGITSANGLAQLVPGMSIASAGPGQAFYEIRGLSSDAGEAPTVGFYLDELAISPPLGATAGKVEIDPDLYDLQRVEVLRGPQGTLYGAGSMGGTIKLVSTPPNLSAFQGSGESVLSGTKRGSVNYAEKGMVNLPLIDDKVALRIVGSYGHDSGYVDRIVVPNFPLETNPSPVYYGLTRGNVVGVPGSKVYKGVNNADTTTARVSLLIKPTDGLTITPSVFYQKISQGGYNAYDSQDQVYPYLSRPPSTLAHYEPIDFAEPFSDTFLVESLTVNYDADLFSVTSATGYWSRTSRQQQDGTEVWQNALFLPSYFTNSGGIGLAYATEADNTRQVSQEIRLASRGEGNFKWLIGGYYSRFQEGTDGPGSKNFAPGAGPLLGTTILSQTYNQTTLSQEAGFANVSYTLKPVTLTLGGRYFAYTENGVFYLQGLAFTGSDAWEALPPLHTSSSGVLPMANLSYAATSDLMLYASASKGYREGAAIVGLPLSGQLAQTCQSELQALGINSVPTSYGPDSVWTYEAGEKGRFFGGRMTLNADVYLTHWSHVQQFISLACGVGFTTNGTDAIAKGAELELRANVTESLSLTQSIGFSHSAFTSTLVQAGVVAGQKLFDTPEWTISTSLQYTQPISSRLKMFAGVSNSYVSSTNELTYSLDYIPSRDITNTRFGIDAGKWTVALFANNVFNQIKPIEYMNLTVLTGAPYDRISVNQPLTAGVDFNISF